MSLLDQFEAGLLPYWVRLAVGSSDLEREPGRLRFVVEGAGETQLANAEIGDYRLAARERLPWRPPLRMSVRARFSHLAAELGGTSGFGFWNNPFELATGGAVVPPNALWFFSASHRSDMVAAPGLPGHGFRAEVINSGTAPGWLMKVGNWLLQLPGMASLLYRASQTRVNAAAVRLDDVDTTGWHDYVLHWGESAAVFSVDGGEVLRAARPPLVPLGFVAWMDNQFAVARPSGEFRFGLEEVPGRQWLELDQVQIEEL